jgi:hypothetical protein
VSFTLLYLITTHFPAASLTTHPQTLRDEAQLTPQTSPTHTVTGFLTFVAMANHGDMFEGASDASSSSHDRYTTTPEEGSPSPPGPPPPPSTTAEIMRDAFMRTAGPSVTDDSIIEMRLRSVFEVKIMSTTLSHPRTVDPEFRRPLWDGEETLRFIGMPASDELSHTSGELNMLFAWQLLVRIRQNKIRALYFHVLDFDFTLIKDRVLGIFSAANREHYNSQQMVVLITISPGFARTWTPTKMEEWLDWRSAEDAAGRELSIEYRVSDSFVLNVAELEGIRNFLHYHDPYGDMEGDMGKIMACFKQYFLLEYQRLGI